MHHLVDVPPVQLDLAGSFFQGMLDQAGRKTHALGSKIHLCACSCQELQSFGIHHRHAHLLQDFERGGMDAILLFFR